MGWLERLGEVEEKKRNQLEQRRNHSGADLVDLGETKRELIEEDQPKGGRPKKDEAEEEKPAQNFAPVSGSKNENGGGYRTDKRGQKGPATDTRKLEYASELGLVARWSHEFGYISVHDPTTGEWHDVATNEVPDWAKREAFKRKELYRDGNRKAYRLTAREMEEIYEQERVEMWEHPWARPAVTDEGIVYEDYLEEEGE
ncbi:MAG: hypothetical protein H0T57_17290 [Rubrobacter sp.]|nr:hypothetical protein [Rubrobacter sp.]MBA3615142.1 hypothetical protein [Rubrobacteraceae bacterium]